jgi:hypothetical protein
MLLASSPNPSLYLRKGIVSLIFSPSGPTASPISLDPRDFRDELIYVLSVSRST